jgi:hypothetical protein
LFDEAEQGKRAESQAEEVDREDGIDAVVDGELDEDRTEHVAEVAQEFHCAHCSELVFFREGVHCQPGVEIANPTYIKNIVQTKNLKEQITKDSTFPLE